MQTSAGDRCLDRGEIKVSTVKPIRMSFGIKRRAANRSTRNTHSMDKERWYKFVFSIYENGLERALTGDRLAEWLRKDGWDTESVRELAREYEQSLTLLRAYDLHRNQLSPH